MRKITKIALVTGAAVAVIGAGAVDVADLSVATTGSQIPTSCVAPLNNGAYKMVADGDAERYDDGVYVCAKGRWILDPDYGQ